MGALPVTVIDAPPARPAPPRTWRADVVALLSYVGLAVLVLWPLWRNPSGAHLVASEQDQALNEWNLARAAHLVTHGGDPFVTTLMNPPAGVNLMANTSVLGLGIPLAPVTLALGPAVSLAIALTVGLAATAAAWYWLLSRRILPTGDAPPTGHLAAAVAGGLIGFSPTLVGHAGGTHLQLVSQFLVPFIVWRAATMWRRPVHDGLLLGLLATYQLFVGEEALLVAAMATAVFLAVRAGQRPVTGWLVLRRFLAGTGVATLVVLTLAGYPLWTQFLGRQSYSGLPWISEFGTLLPAWTEFSTESLGGPHRLQPGMALNPAEQNGFLGWPLLVVAVFAAVWLWRRSAPARAITVTALVFAVLAAGPEVVWAVDRPGVPGPWRLAAELPLAESILPARLAMVVVVCVAVLVALALHRMRASLRTAFVAVLVVALVPIAPTPLTVDARPPVPALFTTGRWREFVHPGHTLVVAPRPDGHYADPMRWQQEAGFGFRINSGYFVGPAADGPHGTYFPPARPSEDLILRAARSGQPQPVSPADRVAARADLRTWRADAVALDPRLPAAGSVRDTVGRLYGVPERLVGGVWLWDVRGM